MVKSNKLFEASEILKILIGNREARFSIRNLSVQRKINYKSAHNAIMKLVGEGVVELSRIGNTIECSFNNNFSPRVFEVEYIRRENLLKDKNMKILSSRLIKINQSFVALLFGSTIKGDKTKFSDIDILIIAEEEKEFEKTLSLIPLNIHLTVINYKEFISMARSKEFSVVSEVMKKNIILNNIEGYYRLLENVR